MMIPTEYWMVFLQQKQNIWSPVLKNSLEWMGQTKLDPEFCADLSLVQQLAPNPPSISLFEQFNRLTSIVVKLHMFGG